MNRIIFLFLVFSTGLFAAKTVETKGGTSIFGDVLSGQTGSVDLNPAGSVDFAPAGVTNMSIDATGLNSRSSSGGGDFEIGTDGSNVIKRIFAVSLLGTTVSGSTLTSTQTFKVSGFTQVNPLDGNTYNIPSSPLYSTYYFQIPGAFLNSLTVGLPATPTGGTFMYIFFDKPITTFTFSGNGHTIIGYTPPTSIVAGQVLKFIFMGNFWWPI